MLSIIVMSLCVHYWYYNVHTLKVMDKKRVELCITAVNVNMLSVEYFHPKTTPNMPVRLAVRMSMAIPGER